MSQGDVDYVLGGRLSMRSSARSILQRIDHLAEHEIAASGWTSEEIRFLENLARMRIDGIPFEQGG